MSYQVTRTITRSLSGAAVLIIYLFHINSRYQAGLLAMDEYQSWALIMLIFIGIGIAVAIVVEIVFHILFSIGVAVKESIKGVSCNEEDIEKAIKQEMVEDEMAKLIDLKSMRAGYITAGIGFIASLIFLALDYPVFLMVNIVFGSFLTAGIIEGIARLYYYKRGV
jgi:hypothetical protein